MQQKRGASAGEMRRGIQLALKEKSVRYSVAHRSDEDEVERSELGNMGLASPSDRLMLRVSIIFNSL